MPKYTVTGYLVTNYTVTVDADNEEEAKELGSDLLAEGIGIEGDAAWQDEYDVWDI
jgi:hypothetical protein